ncbi:protein aau3 [Amylibacter ulvae]|uniref:Protein aau3 n=1 Tax=Paramylibacter ulvae TaxID=1651968 RepID=A0ABQ3D566_9RHOB|nr:Rrf2 family transcriptional regulator [Amylibacter ulvae]GHA57284.1 protein aau3 [Amylibacter ulvae]
MKLSSYSNFALRSLQMAALHHPALVRVDDVVRVHKLSRAHIVKIVHELGRAGYLETVRGRSGGFRLARSADQIVVGDVLRLTEGSFELVECFNATTNTCPLIGMCRLSDAMQRAMSAFIAVFDALTIADISANKSQLLERILPLENAPQPQEKV